jgi:nucleoside-diphosphate-sugar epimerase
LDLSVAGDEKFDVPNPMLKSFRVYAASKLLANKATWDFLANEKPQFSLVTIHPTMVYGNSIIQDSSETGGTNAYIFGCIVNGVKGMDALLKAVHVRDVAQAHIRALDDDIKNKSYLLNGKRMDWKELREWSEKYYPEESKSFKLVSNDQPKVIQTDTSRAEKELGIEWIEPEEMIKEVLDQQISYLKKEGQL